MPRRSGPQRTTYAPPPYHLGASPRYSSLSSPPPSYPRRRTDTSMTDAPPMTSQPQLTPLRVTGWHQSTAVNNPDGGISALKAFLERKASPHRGPNYKIVQSTRDGNALLVSVESSLAQRFKHLHGFKFAGSVLEITEVEQAPTTNHLLQAHTTNYLLQAPPTNPHLQPSTTSFSQHPKPLKPNHTASATTTTAPRHSTPRPPTAMARQGFETATREQAIPVQPARVLDTDGICQNFITTFFPLYDTNPEQLLKNFYDDRSTFSYSVNTRANRVNTGARLDHSWGPYIKGSRNLERISHLPAIKARAFTGQANIFDAWKSLPKTIHPSLDTEQSEWLIECHSLPGLPDPTGLHLTGVDGLIIMVHGSFHEHSSGGQPTSRRSFDRTFILGPGSGLGGIRVISDIMVLRAYGGGQAWQPPTTTNPQIQPTHPELPAGSTYGVPQPGKPDTQTQQEQLRLEMSFKTGMTLAWAGNCLESNGWDMATAVADFEKTRPQIPAEAFLSI